MSDATVQDVHITCDRCHAFSTVDGDKVWLLVRLDLAEATPAYAEALYDCPACGRPAHNRFFAPRAVDYYVDRGARVTTVDPAAKHPSRGV